MGSRLVRKAVVRDDEVTVLVPPQTLDQWIRVEFRCSSAHRGSRPGFAAVLREEDSDVMSALKLLIVLRARIRMSSPGGAPASLRPCSVFVPTTPRSRPDACVRWTCRFSSGGVALGHRATALVAYHCVDDAVLSNAKWSCRAAHLWRTRTVPRWGSSSPLSTS